MANRHVQFTGCDPLDSDWPNGSPVSTETSPGGGERFAGGEAKSPAIFPPSDTKRLVAVAADSVQVG